MSRILSWSTAILMALGMAFHAQAEVDLPERVGRVSFVEGQLDVTPAGEDAPAPALMNYPVAAGMFFKTEAGARAELQLGTLTTRLDGQTKMDLVAFDDQTVGMRLDAGSIDLRIRLLFENERVTISTGDGQVVITEPGAYRIDANRVPTSDKAQDKASDKPSADKAAAVTHVVVFAGSARVHSPHGADLVAAGQSIDVDGPRGTVRYGLMDYTWLNEWAAIREQVSPGATERYVAEDMPGSEALDASGTWQDTADYGAVWYPQDVPPNWAPYQSGTWTWVAPWGWTWIDSRPWGFAPFHYGRWVQVGGRWGWCPGDRGRRHTYAPALVNFGGAFKYTRHHRPDRWQPLAPGERYRPPYRHGVHHVHYVNDGRPDGRRWRGRWDPNGDNGGRNGGGRHDGPRGDGPRGDGPRGGGPNTPNAPTNPDTTLQPGQRVTLPTGGQIVITDDMIRRARGGGTIGQGNIGQGTTGQGHIRQGGNIGGGVPSGSVNAPNAPSPPGGPAVTDVGRRITLPSGGQVVITDDMIRRARGNVGAPTGMPTTPPVNPAGLAPTPVTPMTTAPGGHFARPGVGFGAATQTGPTLTHPRAVTAPVAPQPTTPVNPRVMGHQGMNQMGNRMQSLPNGAVPSTTGRYPTMPRVTAPTPAAPSGYPTQMAPRMGGMPAYTGYPTTPAITAPTVATPPPTPPPTQINPTQLPSGWQGRMGGRVQ